MSQGDAQWVNAPPRPRPCRPLPPQVSQHERCRVRVTVASKPGRVAQKGHKVTMMAIMVSHFPIRLSRYQDQTEQLAQMT